ncbi:type II toxin-antitoxin system CcdA family antitoxin [Endozoicomonas sp. 8E]|uniref:type II toxin-antitoxin system CcdA family antitoxin n=1 Tax=Endozoicomonas sp. 8E TaxID=3035692 RepID=UPI002938ED9C|nr:type II toxin-antitoxin system CcdA family antitoxin [Endozoicomonas sp. 8E]WOG27905.1 type II toxin-antitoxin system CcdA family antitoxin [Endozoicomonas sp. 8E]
MSKSKTTVTIDDELLEQARELKINISSAAEQGVMAEVKSLEEERLKKLYKEAMEEIEQVIKEDGLFSDGMRTF